jgi:hypothetical protein
MFGSRFRFLSKAACAATVAVVAVAAFPPVASAAGVNHPLAAQLPRMERERSYAMAIPFGPWAPSETLNPGATNKSAACIDGYRWMHLKRSTEPVRCTS